MTISNHSAVAETPAPGAAAVKTPDTRQPVAESRRDRKKRETNERIVASARRLFTEHGFEQTTVELIAETADVSKPTLFNYFPSKLALLHALVPETDAYFVRALNRIQRNGGSIQDQLEDFFVFAAGMIRKAPLLARALLIEALKAYTDPAACPERHRFAGMHGALVALVEAAVKRQEVRTDIAAERLAHHISGLYIYELLRWLVEPAYPVEQEARATARFLSSALSAGGQREIRHA